MPNEANMSEVPRRRFIDLLLGRTLSTWLLSTSFGGLLAAILYPVSRYLIPPRIVESDVSTVTLTIRPNDIAPNTGQIFKFGNQPGLIVKTPAGELRAFSARCTHLDCTVQYRSDEGDIYCACHGGRFDLNGRNIAGPPPEPLAPYDVRVRGDQIVVSKRT
jgi:Rieske Fe-S protein